MRKRTPLLLAAVILCGFAMPSAADPTLVGIWYSPFQPDEPNVMSLIEFRSDGTFREEFRKCDDGNFVGYQTETGKWSLSNGVLRMVSDTIDGKPDRFENSYTVELASGDEFRARLHTPNFLFIERRLPKFEFPPCYVGA